MFYVFVVVATVVLIGIVAYVDNLIRQSRRASAVAECYQRFAEVFDDVLTKTGELSSALEEAIKEFGPCPWIRKLLRDEFDRIILIFGAANDPKEFIRQLVIEIPFEMAKQAVYLEYLRHDIRQSSERYFRTLPERLLRNAETASSGPSQSSERRSLITVEQAAEVIGTARCLMGVLRPRFQRDYAAIFANATTPPGKSFELLATIAFVFCIYRRAKLTTPDLLPVSIHTTIKNALAEWYYDSAIFYENLQRFVTENIKPQQSVALRVGNECALAAYWVITTLSDLPPMSDERMREDRSHCVASLATVFYTESEAAWAID